MDNIIEKKIENEMEESYLAYAMSVIVSRALPDARDGLKPVHRRLLYGMKDLGLQYSSSFKKSARIVGDIMGRYHPHGDTAIYDTMVRMAQPWSLRYPLVKGQGNFGSIDGDRPAAYRYTEAKMEKISSELLDDIDKETVEFQSNFDGSLKEPAVLPSKFPNLLVNGGDGIAVGMATKIPPHNLSEIVDGICMYIDNHGVTLEELMTVIKGPDFPTGGFIVGDAGIKEAFKTGRGRVVMKAKTSIEKVTKEKEAIIITEIPFQVNKNSLITSIVELVKDKKVEGISDIRDESDRKGMRVVVELKKGESPELILNHLLKNTQLQASFSVNMVALVKGRPETLSLKELIEVYTSHRFEVVTRRTRFDLKKAEARTHILDGLKTALDSIDKVIKVIRNSPSSDEAQEELIKKFKLSEIQAKAILAMKLSSLTGLEAKKIEDEIKELALLIKSLTTILGDKKEIYKIIKEELQEIKSKYGDSRRSEIVPDEGDIDFRDLIKDEQKLITMTNTGYVKHVPLETYSSQGRGGKGQKGLSMKEDDFVEDMFVARTFDYVMFFSNRGRCFARMVHTLPEGSRTSKGKAVVNFLPLELGEKITSMIPITTNEENEFDRKDELFITMVTREGLVKKSSLDTYTSATREKGIIAIKFATETDEVVGVRISDNTQQLIMGTYDGKAIRFEEDTVRTVGRASQGVKGINLEEDDFVVGMEILTPEGKGEEKTTLLAVTEKGYGKRTYLNEYRITKRAGKGIKNIEIRKKNGSVVCFMEIKLDDEIILISKSGKVVRLKAKDIPRYGRATQGVKMITLDSGDKLVGVSKIKSEDLEDS